jgi:hypothetical protein
VTLKATVTKNTGSGAPTGSVKFLYGADLLSTATLNQSDIATLSAPTTGLSAGSYPLTAEYSGDSGDSASTGILTAVLSKNTTSTALTITPTTVPASGSATFKATVTRADGTGVATGTVTFYYQVGNSTLTALTTATLNGSGVATYSASDTGVPAGNYIITAKYNGDASDNTSTSSTVTVTVE